MKLLLLPGMDGTGELFAPFAAEVSSWARVEIVRYPTHDVRSIDQLVEDIAPTVDEPVTVIAESFSTAVGIRLATRNKNVERMVLAGSFVTPPTGTSLMRVFGRVPFLMQPPSFALRSFLIGSDASDELVTQVTSAISHVAPRVLADRLAQISRVDDVERLRALKIPLMTISARQDRLVSARVTAQMRAVIPGAKHVDLDAPHLLLQARPRETAEHVRAFVRQ
ncbi:MAG: alpha/beta hydrolase [Archangium sp.]|nr:alpha/beta hydrolase [Archangium sp.]